MLDPLYAMYDQLNHSVTFDKISNVVMKAKSKSAFGIDEIPHVVLKYPFVIGVLKQLFQLILDTSIIPSLLRKSITCPILKDPDGDERIPLNYRGISLLSCISKFTVTAYSWIKESSR